MKLAALVAMLMLGAAPPAGLAGARPLLRKYGDWRVACDNSRVCRAQPDAMSEGALMIRRDPGPTGAILVVLNDQEPAEPKVPELSTLKAGAVPVPAAPWVLDRKAGMATLRGAAALRFVRSIADADTLSYRAGGETLEVPLRGMKAALLAIDEVQGRTGGVTALVRPGPRPASAVPGPAPLPAIRIAPPPPSLTQASAFAAAVRRASAARLKQAECAPEMARADAAYALTAGEALVLLGCNMGAHDETLLLARAARTAPAHPQPVRLPNVPVNDPDYPALGPDFPNLEWDPKRATLFAAGWSCAHRCGHNIQWTFSGGDFRLSGFSVYAQGGSEPLEVYRAEIRAGR